MKDILKTYDINHIALHVANVAASVKFYIETICLEQLSRPAFDYDGAWFQIGTTQQLHLIEGRTETVSAGSRSNHFALSVSNLENWEAHLQKQNATFRPIKSRPDGIRQLFVTDPDGHVIELCEVIF